MILIVDDQEDIAAALVRLLRCAGHKSISVNSGQAAIDMMCTTKPSLVVLDLNMPDIDGIQVLRAMHADATLENVPILIYSAETNDRILDEARLLGANAFISKSAMDFDQLVKRIAELAGSPRK